MRAFCSLFFFFLTMCCGADEFSDRVYQKIPDLMHPTVADYRLIQDYLAKGHRPLLNRLGDYQEKAKQFKIIGRRPREVPQLGLVAVNCPSDERNHCILIYSSFNQRYPKGLERLVDIIAHSEYEGHILHRTGGWPDAEGGSLVLAHLPYAFKVCFFREAERLGFKRAFWLDASIVPFVNLNEIFKTIEEQGYFTVGNTHSVGQYFHSLAAAAMGISFEDTLSIPACSAGILGFDFTHEKAQEALRRWYETTKNCEEASYSPRQELNVISIILHQLGMTNWLSPGRMTGNLKHVNAETFFLVDRGFVK